MMDVGGFLIPVFYERNFIMTTLLRIAVPSGANARSSFQPFRHFLDLRDFDRWRKHDVVKLCGIDLLMAGEPARCVGVHG
jgi:hypothetical protein